MKTQFPKTNYCLILFIFIFFILNPVIFGYAIYYKSIKRNTYAKNNQLKPYQNTFQRCNKTERLCAFKLNNVNKKDNSIAIKGLIDCEICSILSFILIKVVVYFASLRK